MAKQKFPEAEKRLFHRIFICMNCGARLRTDLIRVKEGKVKCRKCRRKALRAIHKEHKT
jgi:ribosomal protein L40E